MRDMWLERVGSQHSPSLGLETCSLVCYVGIRGEAGWKLGKVSRRQDFAPATHHLNSQVDSTLQTEP